MSKCRSCPACLPAWHAADTCAGCVLHALMPDKAPLVMLRSANLHCKPWILPDKNAPARMHCQYPLARAIKFISAPFVQESIRGCDVFLIQPTCPPVNDSLMELLVMIDACRRASARSITAVIPYFGYARADRKSQGRESIAAKLVANLITEAGACAPPNPFHGWGGVRGC